MTDEQIVKALEYCMSTKSCEECPICNTDNCGFVLMQNAFDLIKRQQNEIEDLEKNYNACAKRFYKEGIKDFAERLKDIYAVHDGLQMTIDNLVREMTEEEK